MQETKFNISRTEQEGINCIFLQGYLDAHTAPNLESVLGDIVSSGSNKIIVNFKDLDYISSAGLGVFMSFIEEIREAGGDIKLSEMKDKVFSVFDLLGFPILFDIDPTNEISIDKFKSGTIKSDV